jgi:hypothetical protein
MLNMRLTFVLNHHVGMRRASSLLQLPQRNKVQFAGRRRMAWWIVLIVAANVGLIAAALRARRSAQPRKALRRLLIACVMLLTLSGPVGVVLGLIRAFGAVEGNAVEPSQKARVLAQGISEAMNASAFGVLGFLLPTIIALVLLLRVPKPPPPSTTG